MVNTYYKKYFLIDSILNIMAYTETGTRPDRISFSAGEKKESYPSKNEQALV